jgi:hypothetical protein
MPPCDQTGCRTSASPEPERQGAASWASAQRAYLGHPIAGQDEANECPVVETAHLAGSACPNAMGRKTIDASKLLRGAMTNAKADSKGQAPRTVT